MKMIDFFCLDKHRFTYDQPLPFRCLAQQSARCSKCNWTRKNYNLDQWTFLFMDLHCHNQTKWSQLSSWQKVSTQGLNQSCLIRGGRLVRRPCDSLMDGKLVARPNDSEAKSELPPSLSLLVTICSLASPIRKKIEEKLILAVMGHQSMDAIRMNL